MGSPKKLRDSLAALRDHAMALPGAHEDFPWGERVVKVDKKVFVFLGRGLDGDGDIGFGVKLPESGSAMIARGFAKPSGYGLGKSGWVSIRPTAKEPTFDEMRGLVDESYAAVATRRRLAQRGK